MRGPGTPPQAGMPAPPDPAPLPPPCKRRRKRAPFPHLGPADLACHPVLGAHANMGRAPSLEPPAPGRSFPPAAVCGAKLSPAGAAAQVRPRSHVTDCLGDRIARREAAPSSTWAVRYGIVIIFLCQSLHVTQPA